MIPGTQIIAPANFRSLDKGRRYHFIYAQPAQEGETAAQYKQRRVVFVWFPQDSRDPLLHCLSAHDLDYGIHKGLIRVCTGAEVKRFPHWLETREKECPMGRPDRMEVQDGKPLPDWLVVERRVDALHEALSAIEYIFSAASPIKEINRFSAQHRRLNQGRFRAWLLTYLAFGRNRWALLPAPAGRGKYTRAQAIVDDEGHERLKGSQDKGHMAPKEMQEAIVKGFLRFAGKHEFLTEVYEESLKEEFGCVVTERDGEDCITHPDGQPFPSYGQFRYWVVKKLGHEAVWTKLRGARWYRQHFPVPKGAYAEGFQDLLQQVYADAAMSKELPKSYLGEGYTPPLVEVVIVDGLSDMTCAVAFGVGVENESLYMQAQAAMALPTSLYAEVLGLEYADEDWPVNHICLATQTDRGPGGAKRVRKAQKSMGVSFDMTPSYMPQSNAVVEKTHERSPQHVGAPTYVVSELTALQLARQRFIEIGNQNRARDITSRLLPRDLAKGIRTPLTFWRDRLKRGRIAGYEPKVEDVVTTYLPKRSFRIVEGRLEWAGQRYRSPEFEASEFAGEIWRHEGEHVTGYSFDISNLVAWVVIDKHLIKVKVVPGVRDAKDEYALTSFEVAIHERSFADSRRCAAPRRRAVGLKNKIEIPQQTGDSYRPTRTLKGRAKKRTAAIRSETATLRSL